MSEIHNDPAWRQEAPIPTGIEAPYGPPLFDMPEEIEDLFKRWLEDELLHFYEERQPLLEDWRRFQKVYWATPDQKEKNFPFRRAANVVIPLGAIAVETVHARMMNTLFSVKPFYSIRPRRKEWIASAKPFESYLQSEIEDSETLDMYGFCNDAILEMIKLGTCVGKSGYIHDRKRSVDQATGEAIYASVKQGADLQRVPLGNFVMRLAEQDPQDAALVGEKHEVSWGQLKRYVATGRMDKDAVERIRAYWVLKNFGDELEGGATLDEVLRQYAHAEPAYTEVFYFYELWCSFDVDGDGENEEVVVDYHRGARTFLSRRYNWYDDLHRPYRIANYLNVEGLWPGIGVIKQSEQFQTTVTTIHRQRLDNATLANMKQIAVRKSSGYGTNEPIMPGKIWLLNDPVADIREVSLSEVYPSSYANEESLVRYYEKRSAVNEVILGMPQQGTPGTATSDLARLAEGNKRFDLAMRNVKRWLGDIGADIIANMQFFGNQQMHWLVLGEDGQYVEQVLNMPTLLVRRGAVVELTVTDSITNRDVERQNWMALFNLLTAHQERVLMLAQSLGDPQVLLPLAQKALQASDEAMVRLLETFDITDTERFTFMGDVNAESQGQAQSLAEGQNARPEGPSLPPGVAFAPNTLG